MTGSVSGATSRESTANAESTASTARGTKATVVLLGTFDTKGAEYAFALACLRSAGLDVVTVDAGILGAPALAPDVDGAAVAAAAGADLRQLRAAGDRGAAVSAMSDGAARVLADLRTQGRVDGAFALGGTGGTSIAARAFRDLPLGVPKFIVSTAASGDTHPYVGESDLVLVPSIVDIAGINQISAPIIANAVAALAGAVTRPEHPPIQVRTPVAASMFGVTTPCVDSGRELLDERGYDVLVFHMTGVGGRTLESLAVEGRLSGVFDVTTTELADELVGGVFSAGADRLVLSGKADLARVVSVGALDMVNFGPRESVPERFESRDLYVHNPSVTLMRTTPEECHELGTRVAQRVNAGSAPTAVLLPLKGVSAISVEGGPFYDPDADQALFDAIRQRLDRSRFELVELDVDINDPEFARAAGERLHQMMTEKGT